MIVIDVEFSGLNPHKHSILSIGAVDFSGEIKPFYMECRIWEGSHTMIESLEMNGFTQEEIIDKNKPTEGELLISFFAWVASTGEHTIAGQNPHIDLNFLQEASSRWKINFPLAQRTIDLHTVAWVHMAGKGLAIPLDSGHSAINSDFIFTYVGIETEPRPHSAKNGAKWNAEALSRLIYNKNLYPEFKNDAIPWKV